MKTQEFIDSDTMTTPSPSGETPPSDVRGAMHSHSQGRAEIDVRVEQARQQMLELRRQQEQLERERQELEELRRREEDFESGKAEMLEELSRMVAQIEHDEFELNKRSTMLSHFREIYQDYTRQLNDIRESDWTGDELKTQLSKAAAVVEAARAELNKGRAQLALEGSSPVRLSSDPTAFHSDDRAPRGDFDFRLEFQRGLARNLSLILLGLIVLIFLLSRGK